MGSMLCGSSAVVRFMKPSMRLPLDTYCTEQDLNTVKRLQTEVDQELRRPGILPRPYQRLHPKLESS
ncbi:hypothetical protein PROFUN_00897 [Planoprotostelium fungivorum]|uniref:Uncharacterized protein n=1 Tax=Planoprotostelium fungivorum TaxID=1890364 RepID=A0A2P6P094_9EUKA|nr:hypothetical protein PROFUN_00897 [Planoprotostelium fungivorum]